MVLITHTSKFVYCYVFNVLADIQKLNIYF